jgi:hypothetical protein
MASSTEWPKKSNNFANFEVIFEMVLENESGDQAGLIRDKNQRLKISRESPFKAYSSWT